MFGVGWGVVFGVTSVFAIVFIYIPSFVSNVLKFRAGVLPSLGDSMFEVYRRDPINANKVFGSTFWGMIFTAAFAFIIPGGIAFLLVWSTTRSVVTNIAASLIGLFVTMTIKIVVIMTLRKKLMVAFYRKKPFWACLVDVILECWNIGLTAGYITVRTAMLFLVTIFYLGRIDTPILAPGVGQIGSIILDKSPIAYRQDLLSHEAHRHPWLERLGALYLLKLKHGNDFGTRAGSCWRLLYVMFLMPWLREHRGLARSNVIAVVATESDGGLPTAMLENSRDLVDAKKQPSKRSRMEELRQQSRRLSVQSQMMRNQMNVAAGAVDEEGVEVAPKKKKRSKKKKKRSTSEGTSDSKNASRRESGGLAGL